MAHTLNGETAIVILALQKMLHELMLPPVVAKKKYPCATASSCFVMHIPAPPQASPSSSLLGVWTCSSNSICSSLATGKKYYSFTLPWDSGLFIWGWDNILGMFLLLDHSLDKRCAKNYCDCKSSWRTQLLSVYKQFSVVKWICFLEGKFMPLRPWI